jgi:hypothetical protein
MRFLRTKTEANEVHKHKIKGNRGGEAPEQRQLRLLSTQIRQMRFLSTRKKSNEVHKHNKIKGKLGCKAQEQR